MLLYRLKKYQYILYKHFLLHGLNVSVAVSDARVVHQSYFRVYWLALNASYVMEFFLQTLVKKSYMTQSRLLVMQKILMIVSTVVALRVILVNVNPFFAMVSLFLNFTHRNHEIANIVLTIAVAACYGYMYTEANSIEELWYSHRYFGVFD